MESGSVPGALVLAVVFFFGPAVTFSGLAILARPWLRRTVPFWLKVIAPPAILAAVGALALVLDLSVLWTAGLGLASTLGIVVLIAAVELPGLLRSRPRTTLPSQE